MPTPDEARLLELDPGVAVVRMLHIDYDPDGRTLQGLMTYTRVTGTSSRSSGPSRMGRTPMGEWPRNWDELMSGGCECARPGAGVDRYGERIFAGGYSDAYLQRADRPARLYGRDLRGRSCHRATELDDAEAAGYWAEVLAVARCADQRVTGR